jgi:hypothetical protein
LNKVCCRDCLGFIPDQIGFGYGLGECKAYEHYVSKGANNSQLRLLLIDLGNSPDYQLFWGGTATRECKKFKPNLDLFN